MAKRRKVLIIRQTTRELVLNPFDTSDNNSQELLLTRNDENNILQEKKHKIKIKQSKNYLVMNPFDTTGTKTQKVKFKQKGS